MKYQIEFKILRWAGTSKVNQYNNLKLNTAAVKDTEEKLYFPGYDQRKDTFRTTCTIRLEHHKLLINELWVIINNECCVLYKKQPKQHVWLMSTCMCVFISTTKSVCWQPAFNDRDLTVCFYTFQSKPKMKSVKKHKDFLFNELALPLAQ